MASIWGDANITRIHTALLAFEVRATQSESDKAAAISAYQSARSAYDTALNNPTITADALKAAYDAVDASEKVFEPLRQKVESQTKALSMLRDLLMLMADADAIAHAFG
jgi:hypothetical protein